MSFETGHLAIKGYLRGLTLSVPPERIAFDNEPFDPDPSETWLRWRVLPSTGDRRTIGGDNGDLRREGGRIQGQIHGVSDTAEGAVLAIAAELEAALRDQTIPVSGSSKAVRTGEPTPPAKLGTNATRHYEVHVEVPYTRDERI